MPEGQVVHKTETPVTVESLQADFEGTRYRKGDDLTRPFVLERDGMGLRRSRCCHHCASGSIGRNWNACDADSLDGSQRTESVGESARAGVVVANNTGDDACLRSRFDTYPFNGKNC